MVDLDLLQITLKFYKGYKISFNPLLRRINAIVSPLHKNVSGRKKSYRKIFAQDSEIISRITIKTSQKTQSQHLQGRQRYQNFRFFCRNSQIERSY